MIGILFVFIFLYTMCYVKLQQNFPETFTINYMGLCVLGFFSWTIPFFYLFKQTSSRILRSEGIIDPKTFLILITVLISFMQVIFLWSGAVNVMTQTAYNSGLKP